jgi:hypothetical protein
VPAGDRRAKRGRDHGQGEHACRSCAPCGTPRRPVRHLRHTLNSGRVGRRPPGSRDSRPVFDPPRRGSRCAAPGRSTFDSPHFSRRARRSRLRRTLDNDGIGVARGLTVTEPVVHRRASPAREAIPSASGRRPVAAATVGAWLPTRHTRPVSRSRSST